MSKTALSGKNGDAPSAAMWSPSPVVAQRPLMRNPDADWCLIAGVFVLLLTFWACARWL